MIKRRELAIALLSLGIIAAPLRTAAERIRRIGFISTRSGPGEFDAVFQQALQDLGYLLERSIQIEYRWAAGSEKRAEELAAELASNNIEIIVAATTVAIRAAMRATSRIPIVMAVAADPIGSGLVASLSRPGGNVTGLSLMSSDTVAKRLQILLDLIPAASRVAVLLLDRGTTDDALVNSRQVNELRAASQHLRVLLSVTTIGSAADIARAFEGIRSEDVQAVVVPVTPLAIDNRAQIVELAAQYRLPVIYEDDRFVAAGGLLSYAPSLKEMYRRAATYVDRILRGASLADLPIEQPTKFDLVINVATAKALGLTIPPTLLARADEVVE